MRATPGFRRAGGTVQAIMTNYCEWHCGDNNKGLMVVFCKLLDDQNVYGVDDGTLVVYSAGIQHRYEFISGVWTEVDPAQTAERVNEC